jgi:NAD(P)H-hydrate epimerase
MESWLEPLHDAETMRAVDAWTIDERGVPSLELMEAAGRAVAAAAESATAAGPARVVCGKGNNGGDGLVAARHLAAAGHEVEVLLLAPPGELSEDATANLARYEGQAREVEATDAAAALAGSGVVIDAIFGTGFSGATRDPAATVIEAINGCGAAVVAADIASGVDASTGEVEGPAVEAAVTVSFHAAKVGHWVAPGKRHTGELRVTPIGIPEGVPGQAAAGLIHSSILELLAPRGPDSTKFSSGQVLIVGGSRGLTGSVCLASSAATRAGAGYVTVAVPSELESIFEIKLTEVMSIGVPGADGGVAADAVEPILAAAERRGAVVLGPGLGRSDAVTEVVRDLVARLETPLVLDADGLNAIAGRLELLAGRSAPTVLTPHAGELARLLETDSADVGAHRLASAREAASRAAAVVVLKGDDSIIAAPDERPIVNGLASPALATAGTGDVLSGMIAALIARGLDARTAAAAAVHAHTRAGRIAADRVGATESVIATDVIGAIPAGLRHDARRSQ